MSGFEITDEMIVIDHKEAKRLLMSGYIVKDQFGREWRAQVRFQSKSGDVEWNDNWGGKIPDCNQYNISLDPEKHNIFRDNYKPYKKDKKK